MIPDHGPADRLRAALARSAAACEPRPAPVDSILAAGRTRRGRRRAAVVAAAACVLAVAGLSLPLDGLIGPARTRPAASGPSVPPPLSVEIGHGTVDGVAWSARLEFYPVAPPGAPEDPGVFPPGMSQLCERVVFGGVPVPQGQMPWADCSPVQGADADVHGGGLRTIRPKDTDIKSPRFYVSQAQPQVAYGVVTLDDGTKRTARSVRLPGTGYQGWAVAIPGEHTIATIDEYDAHHHRIGHSTAWR